MKRKTQVKSHADQRRSQETSHPKGHFRKIAKDSFGGAHLGNGGPGTTPPVKKQEARSRWSPRPHGNTKDVYVNRRGRPSKTHAKIERPIRDRRWHHVCLRSSQARGPLSMRNPKHRQHIERAVRTTAKSAGLKIGRWANVGNHLHFSIFVKERAAYIRWIRAITGVIARIVTGKERGRSRFEGDALVPPRTPFWDSRPFTRIVHNNEGYWNLTEYVVKNQLEGTGVALARAKEIARMWRLHREHLENEHIPRNESPPPGW